MKAKVKKPFVDKNTNEFYEEGRIIEVDQERYDEIQTVDDLIEEFKDKSKAKKEDKE